jgi:DNA-binding FadR family transcriptional regulator
MVMSPNFAPIKSRRLFEDICTQIRAQLEAGILQPGDKLPAERQLAAQFQVSRAAVREALITLENAGIVELQKGAKGGAFILDGREHGVTSSITDMMILGRVTLEHLTEARIMIQDAIIHLACERATEQDFEALEKNIDALAKLCETEEGNNPENKDRLELNTQFYRTLASAAHNSILSMIVDSLMQVQRAFMLKSGFGPKYDLVRVRRRFLKALRERNAARATKEMTTHLEGLKKHLLAHKEQMAVKSQ